jgi:RHS repeat-associated protein
LRRHSSTTQNNPVDDFRYRINTGGGANRMRAEESAGLILKRRFASQVQLMDITGDKRTDIVYQCVRGSFTAGEVCPFGVTASDGTYPMRAKIWNSGGFFLDRPAATGWLITLGNQNPDEYLALGMDLGGDGAPDILRYKANATSSGNFYLISSLLKYGGSDFIVKFTNGFNVDHHVTYAPLVSKFTYEREFDGPRKNFGRGSVVFDVFSPLWAVREACSTSPGIPVVAGQVCQATGQAQSSIIRYSYRGARVQTGGRGFLGFASIRTEDIQNILVTTTDYRQDYPYVGRASRTAVEKRGAIIPDNICLANPTDPSCFEEPPDDCGGGICPKPNRTAQRQLLLQAPESFAPLDDPINCQFDAPLVPVITDSTSCFTSTPVFSAATRQPIVVYSNTSGEKRYDLITGAQTQRIATLMVMDTWANLTVQESTTFDATDAEVERKGQLNFYGCTETPVVLIKGTGCASTASPASPERIRLGRLSLTSIYSVRGGEIKERRSSFEYDATTLLLNAEVQGVYNYGNPGEPPLSAKARMHQRTDYLLDTNGNRTLSVTCDVSSYPNRAACTNLSAFQQQQWPATPTRFQRYTRMEYDTLGRFMQGSRSPYYSATNAVGVEAYNERSGVNAAGSALHRNVYGDPLGALTAHNVFAEKAYGPMGREYFAKAATGAFSRNTYAWCTDASSTTLPDASGGIPSATPRVNCPVGAIYRVESNTSEGELNTQFIAPRSFAYFDKLGRNILSASKLYQSSETDPSNVSRWASAYTRLDVLGRVKAKSEPYLSTDPLTLQSTSRAGSPQSGITPAETRTNYDVLGRSASVELPSESYNGMTLSSAEFDRMQTKSFNPRSNPMTMDKNGLAESSAATDANNFQVSYRYEPQGNMDQVTRTPNDGSNAFQPITTSLSYDVLGRKSSMVDPDKGTLTYSYNPLGELLTQVDAKGQTQSLFYDALGRLIERREDRKLPNGSFQAEPTARWVYDDALLVGTSQKAVGLLISESNGLSGTGQFARGYSYDSYGRSVALATNLEGTLYYQRTTYDQYGRVFQSFDASTNASSPNGQLQIYSSDGYPIGVREAANGSTGILYSEVLALTARQQVRRERYHSSSNLVSDRTFEDNTGRLAAIQTGINGSLQKWNFRWDKNGSLSERSDTTNGADWKEDFVYDTLDRLTTVKQVRTNGIATPSSVSLALQYDQLGNITSKTGFANASLGSYQYKTFEAGCASPAGPHAASLVNGKSYCYDVNGNNTEVRKNGSVIRTIVYTGFDLAESIVRDELTAEGRIQAQVSFQYGTDRAMFKRTDGAASSGGDQIFKTGFEDNEPPTPVGGGGSKVTYYVGNVEFIREGITSSTKRYIGNYLVITNVGNNAAVFDYLLRDSLGSIDTIASETGVLKSRQSFNAHGQRRQAAQSGITASWSTLSLLQASLFNTSTTTQGYTGHEQLDQVGLVHMGARLYDPELGRFLQADSEIENDATQGLNRYSYVLNNPLSATDPTGNFSLRQALGVVVGVVAAIFTAGAGLTWTGFFIATGGGFASAAIATGSLKAGLWGAVSAAAFWGVGSAFSNVVGSNAKAVAAGTMKASKLMESGLTSGQTIAKIAAHAGAGGTLSVLQGGKFGHGFMSAGFTEALSPAIGQLGEGRDFGTVLAKTAASAAISGTASKLSGGSFSNGAATGAFQQLFASIAVGGAAEEIAEDGLACKAGIGNPFGPTWSAKVANKDWIDNISVSLENGVTVIRGAITVSGQGSAFAASDVTAYWNGASGEYNGAQYRSEITVTRVKSNGDWRISGMNPKKWSQLNAKLCSGVIGGSNAIGGSDFKVPPVAGIWKQNGTSAHEFGHALGLTHAPAGSGSLMSYDATRSVLGRDLYNIATTYQGGK